MRMLCMLALGLLPACIIEGDDHGGGTYYCGDRSIDAPFETCDDGNAVSGDGCSATCQTEYESFNTFITASWNLRTVAGTSVACPTNYDTVAVYSQPVNAMGAPAGAPIVDLYDCASKIGTTAPLPGGQYLVWIEIENYSGTQTYAKSLSANVDTRQGDQAVSVSIYTDGGFFQMAWALVGASSNALLTCAQAGASGGIESVATDIASPTNAASDRFTCEDGGGVTDAFLAGTYTLSIKALNADDAALGSAPALTNKQIQAPNLVTDLGLVTIPIAGH